MAREYVDQITSAFYGADDEHNSAGIRPVVFDILAPDRTTSLLPDDLKMVLHVNPSTMSITRTKVIERIQTLGGFVEQHWGDAPTEISLEMSTGGFMRLYTGLTSFTGTGSSSINTAIRPMSMQGMADQKTSARRESIAYDKYLDLLALFHNNGTIYDQKGNSILQGQIKISFDQHNFYGWFTSFSVSESAETPYSFKLSAAFTVARESHKFYSFGADPTDYAYANAKDPVEDGLEAFTGWGDL